MSEQEVKTQKCEAQYLYIKNRDDTGTIFTCERESGHPDMHYCETVEWKFLFCEDERSTCPKCDELMKLEDSDLCFFCSETIHYECRTDVMCQFRILSYKDVRNWCGKCDLKESHFYDLIVDPAFREEE